ncbi:MAG: PAS domain-containing sensor histidine kinase [Planctomycetes bacterium RBG_13_62_9]|nr:MAG: PAS domain-containing sensor histidine kinase [Planctomycetes bacterium RBG_13_62_9]
MKWTLRKKILIGYGIALILMVVIITWSLANLLRLGEASDAVLTENYKSILAAENMIDALGRQDSAMLFLMLGSAEEGLTQFRENENLFLQWLGRAKDNVTIEGEEKIIESIERGYSAYLVDFSNLGPQIQARSSEGPVFYRETALPAFKLVRNECIHLRQINEETMFRASNRAARIAQRAAWSVPAIGIAAVALGLAFSLLLSHRLVRPLRQLTDATRKRADGDYNVRVPAHSSDELGDLSFDFNMMAERLKEYKELDLQQILAEKHKSEAIIRSIDDGIVVCGADDLQITEINPTAAAAFSIPPQEARGRHILEVIKNERLFACVKRGAESGEPPLEEDQCVVDVPRNGAHRYYQFSITPVRSAGELGASIVLLLRDVTRLKELDRLKSEFVMAASHELRTPLTGIGMSVELLGESAASKLNEKEQQLLAAAREEILRLKALVNDLLDVSKIEAGKMPMDFERVSVGAALEKAAAVLASQAQQKGIELSATVQARLPDVRADINKITWVLTNLLSNALRYTGPGGFIRLRAERVGLQVHISVADNGEGIPYEYQSRIFDKFIQIKGQKAVGGSGLGLSICKEIVRAHGGTIWVDSAPGQGSTFTFTLPVVE